MCTYMRHFDLVRSSHYEDIMIISLLLQHVPLLANNRTSGDEFFDLAEFSVCLTNEGRDRI